MSKFLAGFALASVLWGGFLVAYRQGWIDISLEPEAPQEDVADVGDQDAAPEPDRPHHRRRRRSARHRHAAAPTGTALVGDDLRENEARSVSMGSSGGEEQLLGTEIEKGFDSIFSQVRRCLILAAGEEPAQGKLVFGLRISGAGKVTAVNLSGPASVAKGDSGACLRKAAASMHFRTFNGPDMVVHYPLELE